MAVPSKRELRDAIKECGGVIADIAKHYDVSRPTIYDWLDKKDLREEVTKSRQRMVKVAEDNIYGALIDGDLDISKFVVERKGRQFGWTKQIDVGQTIPLSPDVMALMDKLGLDVNSIGDHLLPILEELAAESNGES